MQYFSISFLSLLAAGAEAAHLGPRASPAICSTLNSCYSRFAQASTASAFCSSFLLATQTKSVTVTQTATASTKVVTKIVTVKGTTTIPQTSTVNAVAAYVTSYQPCTTATAAIASTPTSNALAKRQASSVPGCLQYMVGTALAATSTACKCVATASTPIVSFTKTVTPKIFTYTWTGTVSLESTISPVTVVTVTPTYTVTMDPLPCALTSLTTSAATTPTAPVATTPTSSDAITPATSATPTPTANSAPSMCNNQGLQYEIFTDMGSYYHGPTWYQFENYISGMPYNIPQITGLTTTIGGFTFSPDSGDQTTIYNITTPFDAEHWVINQQGYILATQTGSYVFNIPAPDDYVAVWVGPNAASGWTTSNANGLTDIVLPAASFTYNMTAGQYYPFRTIYANSYGGGGYFMQIVNPDGSNFTTSSESGNPNIIQFSCDGTSAPALPGWATSGTA